MISRKIAPVVACAVLLAIGTAAASQQSAQQPGQQSGEQSAQVPKEEAQQKSQYLRVVRDDQKRPVALETAIVRCAPVGPGKKGPTVDLVAAVHVAEGSYYRQLNREFAGYDVVLYELVAPEGTKVRPGGGGGSPLSFLQNAVKDLLALEFQLNEIDYSRKNMVHADMSPEQFAKSMRDRGESVFAIFLRMMGYAIARQQGSDKPTDAQFLLALFDKNRTLALKRLMAEEFEDMEGSLMAIEGTEGSTLIAERNKVALKVLSRQLASGKRKIAIFYGAAHMSDLQRRLREQFQMRPASTRWLVAWKMTSKPKKREAATGSRAVPQQQ